MATKPLHRYCNPNNGDHFYTTNAKELGTAAGAGANSGYTFEGVIGHVFAFEAKGQTKPLHRYCNVKTGDHFYTSNANELGTAAGAGANSGHTFEGVIGHVATGGGAGCVPLHRYCNVNNGDHFYTTNANELGTAAGAGANKGHTFEGVIGHILAKPRQGTPLHRYCNPKSGDHFYTVNANELGTVAGPGANSGYTFEGVIGKVWTTGGPGTVPLHRYCNTGNGDHFYTTNANELGTNAGAGANSGHTFEGVIGHLSTSAFPGSKPLHRYCNVNNGDHFYTTNANELGTAAGAGANSGHTFEGVIGHCH